MILILLMWGCPKSHGWIFSSRRGCGWMTMTFFVHEKEPCDLLGHFSHLFQIPLRLSSNVLLMKIRMFSFRTKQTCARRDAGCGMIHGVRKFEEPTMVDQFEEAHSLSHRAKICTSILTIRAPSRPSISHCFLFFSEKLRTKAVT